MAQPLGFMSAQQPANRTVGVAAQKPYALQGQGRRPGLASQAPALADTFSTQPVRPNGASVNGWAAPRPAQYGGAQQAGAQQGGQQLSDMFSTQPVRPQGQANRAAWGAQGMQMQATGAQQARQGMGTQAIEPWTPNVPTMDPWNPNVPQAPHPLTNPGAQVQPTPASQWQQPAWLTNQNPSWWAGQGGAGAINYLNAMQPWQQMQQNASQYQSDFNEAQRRWNQENQWQQAMDQYTMGLSGRQQQAAEWQMQQAANQWGQQFGWQQQNDTFNQGLANRQLEQEAALSRESLAAQQAMNTMQVWGRAQAPNARWQRSW